MPAKPATQADRASCHAHPPRAFAERATRDLCIERSSRIPDHARVWPRRCGICDTNAFHARVAVSAYRFRSASKHATLGISLVLWHPTRAARPEAIHDRVLRSGRRSRSRSTTMLTASSNADVVAAAREGRVAEGRAVEGPVASGQPRRVPFPIQAINVCCRFWPLSTGTPAVPPYPRGSPP